jgi:hypothetical protein
VKFELSPAALTSSESLKATFTSDTILAHFDPDLVSIVETDTSNIVSAGIFSLKHPEGRRPVAYHSKKHLPVECNYEIYDKELIVIVRAFEEWCRELEGTKDPVEGITDLKNLEYFMSSKKLTRHQAC